MNQFAPFWSLAEKLSTFNTQEKEQVEQAFVYREIPKNFKLLDFGERASEIYFILEGYLRFYYLRDDGAEITGFIFPPHHFASSYESLLSYQPSDQALESVTDAKLLVMHRDHYLHFIENMSSFERLVRKVLEQRMIHAQQVVASLIMQKPEERYTSMLELQPDLVQHIPQHILSAFLGITPVSLSRIRKRLSDKT